MFGKTKLYAALVLAFGGGAAVTAFPALAQDTPDVQRVEVTGSSIKRINAESALPVQSITQDDIKRSGATSVTELIQALPAMQGFTTASQSINGGGGGAATASLHALGSSYTLVLLNGRRLAPLNTGSTVNLNSIPLAAIERIDVLLDGASAIYGSDAIAGVVNFITKKDATDGFLTASVYVPQKSGGGSSTVSLSKGIGDLTRDKFNILLSGSFDKQNKLDASQRSFSKTGLLTFEDQGQPQEVDLVSSNTVPANARTVKLSDGATLNFNPYLLKNGSCPAGQVQGGNQCFFDYPATVESIPGNQRVSLFGSGRLNVSDNLSLFTELGWSRFYNDPRYAAPAQPGLPLNATLIANDIQPYLAQLGHPDATVLSATMNLRLFDAGGRQDRYKTDALHVVLGGDATVAGIDLTGSFTHSQNKFSDTVEGGYSSLNAFNALIDSGTWDPLMALPGTAVDLVAPIVLHQVVDQSKSSIDVLQGSGSATVGRLPGGDIKLALGAGLTKQKYSDSPSEILQGNGDAIVGGAGGVKPFDSSRGSAGVFSELVLPVSKALEFSGSARYDSYEAVKNSQNFDQNGNPIGEATQGKKSSSGTFKLSGRFQPSKELLFRGSLGTGFKAPTLANITSPLAAFGNTGFHDCPPGLDPAKAAYCAPIAQEYNIQAGGNPSSDSGALKPEKSTQWTLGFRFEPAAYLSFGADLWTVNLKDQINTITENTAFSNGAQYDSLFTVAPDPITGTPTLTFLSVPINTGKAHYQGIDLDGESRVGTAIGKLTTRVHATYMMHANYQTPGTPGYINSMNKIGLDGQVTFQWQATVSATLQSGPFANTLTANFKPGYMDDTLDYCRTDANGDCLLTKFGDPEGRRVSSYALFDWQTKYDVNKAFAVTGGVKNIFDRNPPFSLIDQAGTGNARGFDGRYTDPIGRQFYLSGNYKF